MPVQIPSSNGSEKVAQHKTICLDLTRQYPRSPRETLGGFVIAARILDKCRALLNGTIGAYKYGSSIDQLFFNFAGITPEQFKEPVAQGLDDFEFADWLQKNATPKEQAEIIEWNNTMRSLRICDCTPELQGRLTNYIKNNLPEGSIFYSVLDIFDTEEGRLPVISYWDQTKHPGNIAPDLSKMYPRSPRALLGGYVIAGRMLDKCRAVIAGLQGDYDFDCGLDRHFLGFTEIKADEFKAYVEIGASDEQVGQWIADHAKPRDLHEIMLWNNEWLNKHMCDLDPATQAYMETYIESNLPENAIVRALFDVFDIEEKRIQV